MKSLSGKGVGSVYLHFCDYSGTSQLKKIGNLWIRENLVMTSGYDRTPTGLTDSEGRGKKKTQYRKEGNPRRVPCVSF